MVEACYSPRSPCTLRSLSSSSASAEAAATLAALAAAAEQLISESDGEERLWRAPEVHELPKFNRSHGTMAREKPERQDEQRQPQQPARASSALATALRQAALPQQQAVDHDEVDIISDSGNKPYSESPRCSQGASAASNRALYHCDPIGRRMRNSKLRHVWMLRFAGEPQETKVELLHSRLTGKKQVLVDGKVMYSSRRKCLNWYWEHPVSNTRVSLRSENGSHQLVCEEPKHVPASLDHSESLSTQDLVSRERPHSPRSPQICLSPTLGSPRSPAPLSSPQSLWQATSASHDAVSATVRHCTDVNNANAGSDHHDHDAHRLWLGALGGGSTPTTGISDTVRSEVSAAQDKQNHFMQDVIGKRDEQTSDIFTLRARSEDLNIQDEETRCLQDLTENIQDEETRCLQDLTEQCDKQTSDKLNLRASSDGLAAQDEENRRLQDLIEQRDRQIASLQGQLQQHPAGSPAEMPEHSPLDDEELDVTRRLGPVLRLPDMPEQPARARASSVEGRCGQAAGIFDHADKSRCRPIEVKVEVKARQSSVGAPRGRAVSTPPAVQHIRPQSARHERNLPYERHLPSSATPSSHAQAPVQYRQVMTPRRMVPVPVQQQPPGSNAGVGQPRSATPGPCRDRHFSSVSSSLPSAPAGTPAACFVGMPSGCGSITSPRPADNPQALQRTPRAASSHATPRATSHGPVHARPPAAGQAFGSRSLMQPQPGMTIPGGLHGFAVAGRAAPSLAAAASANSGSYTEHVESTPRCLRLPPAPLGSYTEQAESTPRCLRLPPAPFQASPGGRNGISPCAASIHNYGVMPGLHGGLSIGPILGSGISNDGGVGSLKKFGPACGLQEFQQHVVLCPTAP